MSATSAADHGRAHTPSEAPVPRTSTSTTA